QPPRPAGARQEALEVPGAAGAHALPGGHVGGGRGAPPGGGPPPAPRGPLDHAPAPAAPPAPRPDAPGRRPGPPAPPPGARRPAADEARRLGPGRPAGVDRRPGWRPRRGPGRVAAVSPLSHEPSGPRRAAPPASLVAPHDLAALDAEPVRRARQERPEEGRVL